MLRRASTILFCAFGLIAPAYSQDVFVPRELKAEAVHPAKPKEVVRRAEPATDSDLKPVKPSAPKTDATAGNAPKTDATTKTDKTAPKEKSLPVTDEATRKKTAKAEPAKDKIDKVVAAKEKSTAAKMQAAADNVPTIKIEKTAARDAVATKAVPSREKSDVEIPTIKVEKVTASKEPAATKIAPKTETTRAGVLKDKPEKPVAIKEKAEGESVAKTAPAKSERTLAKSEKPASQDDVSHKSTAKNEGVKVETITEKPVVKEKPATVAASRTLRDEKNGSRDISKTETAKPEVTVTVAKTEKPAAVQGKEKPAAAAAPKLPPAKPEPLIARVEPAPPREGPVTSAKLPMKSEQVSTPFQKDPSESIPAVSGSLDMGFTKIADGFDFPVGKPEAEGYYKARGFRAGGHVGEDWDGVGGGDTDLRDPIYSIGDGIVVFARDVHLGWGNVIIVRHAYRENGNVRYVDALYGHLNSMLVSRGQRVTRGQQIATMGTAHGQYDAHLHFEVRRNLEIGMSRSKFQKDFSNYYDPTQFISSHRHLSGGGANYKVAMNTFTHDWAYHFERNRDFGHRKRGTSESSAALRRAVTSR